MSSGAGPCESSCPLGRSAPRTGFSRNTIRKYLRAGEDKPRYANCHSQRSRTKGQRGRQKSGPWPNRNCFTNKHMMGRDATPRYSFLTKKLDYLFAKLVKGGCDGEGILD